MRSTPGARRAPRTCRANRAIRALNSASGSSGSMSTAMKLCAWSLRPAGSVPQSRISAMIAAPPNTPVRHSISSASPEPL